MDKLTPQERVFIDEYCGPSNFDSVAAAKAAGYKHHGHRHRSVKLLEKPNIQNAISSRLDNRKAVAWYSEDDILKMLMTEAQREGKGSTHSGRIQAIVYLGKHLGMFSDKKEEVKDQSTTINVVNYASGDTKIEKLIENNEKEVLEHKADNVIEGLTIENYAMQTVSEEGSGPTTITPENIQETR